MKKHSQRGYSLIELSIVLAIIAVIIGGAIAGVQSILRSNTVNNVISSTNKSVGAITSKLIREQNYAGATMQNLSSRGMEVWSPKSVLAPGTANATVQNDFGGATWVAPLSVAWQGYGINQAYIYTMTGIPTAACVDLVLGLESLGIGVSVTNQLATAVAAAPTVLGPTIVKQANPNTLATLATVSPACAPAANDVGQTTISLLIPRS